MSKRLRSKRARGSRKAKARGRAASRTRASKRRTRRASSALRGGLVVFVVALVLRAIHLVALSGSPLFDTPLMDARYNTEWASRIAQGEVLGSEVFFRAPFYSYFLALFYWIAGGSGIVYWLIHAAQMLLGALNCSLLYDLGRRVFDARVGWLAGLMAAFYWAFIYFEGEFLLPVVLIFQLLMALRSLVLAVERRRLVGFAVAGLFLGLFAITRPNILFCLPPLMLWLYAFGVPDGLAKVDRARSWLIRSALVAAGVTLCVAPVTLRNWLVADDLVLVSSQGGVNFYIGNNPKSDGKTAIVPGTRASWWGGYEDTIRIAERERGRELEPSEVSDYWLEEGLAFLRAEPTAAVALYWKKLRLLLDAVEISNNQNIYFFIKHTGFLSLQIFVSFWMLAPLALAGAIRLPRDRWWWLLNGFVVTYLASFLFFFITARYRVPTIPCLILMASAFLVRSRDEWEAGERRRTLWSGGLVAVVLGLLLLNSSPHPKVDLDGPSTGHFTLGSAYIEKKQPRKAIPHFEKSARLGDPHRSGSYLRLGELYLELGEEDKALGNFNRSIDFETRRWEEVADYLLAQGEVAFAERFFSQRRDRDTYAADLSLKLTAAYRRPSSAGSGSGGSQGEQ